MNRIDDLIVTVDYPNFDPGVRIYTDYEPAAYIAKIMREEFDRTADAGALGIAQAIEEKLAEVQP